MEASVARQDELVELVSSGVKVESVRDADTDELFEEKVHDVAE